MRDANENLSERGTMNILFKPAGFSRVHTMFALVAASVLISGCTEPDVILPGKRESVESIVSPDTAGASTELVNQTRAISLPTATVNSAWPQASGTPAFRTNHPALNAPLQPLWSANIGSGDSRKQRIIASPVIAQGLIYTLDSDALVTATSVSGQTVWQNDVRPSRDKDGQATGGGVAYADGKLYVALGYGSLVALDAGSGAEIWRQRLEGTGSGAPTVVDGILYVTSGDDRGWAIKAEDGTVIWQLTASPDVNNSLGAPAPAIAQGMAVFAFGSGEVQGVFQRGGLRRWDATVAGVRPGIALGNVGDVTGQPVISGRTVYVGNQSGRTVALDVQSGDRLWTATDGAVGNIVPAGDSVFIVTDQNELVRLDANNGSRIWAVDLPKYVKKRPRKRAAIVVHHGPVLAGGRIHVASDDGALRSFDPTNGALLSTAEIPGGATSDPIVAGAVMYVVSSKGKLHAFR